MEGKRILVLLVRKMLILSPHIFQLGVSAEIGKPAPDLSLGFKSVAIDYAGTGWAV